MRLQTESEAASFVLIYPGFLRLAKVMHVQLYIKEYDYSKYVGVYLLAKNSANIVVPNGGNSMSRRAKIIFSQTGEVIGLKQGNLGSL